MAPRLALLAGSGDLPARLSTLRPDALCISFAGVPHALSSAEEHRFEQLGAVFETLKAHQIDEVVMAGGMSRPPLDPASFDPVMTALAPRLVAAFQGGDDALLRLVISIFEDQGFAVRGAHEIDPSLTPEAGLLAGPEPAAQIQGDIARAIEVLNTLSPLDIAQGCVIEAGLCLGIETLQGTDALLRFVQDTPAHLRRSGGILLKAPKQGQDLRVDMPTIGPQTLEGAKAAGLSAVVCAAGAVNLLDRPSCAALAQRLEISLIAVEV